MKRFINGIYAILAITIFTVAISASTGLNPMIVGGGLTVLSLLPSGAIGVAYDGLNKEIWLPEIMEGFYGDDMFLTEARNMDAFVDNNTINLAEAGVNPNVLINYAGDVATAERADGAIEIQLDRYDTENTLLKNAEQVELAYDKRQSVMYGHRQALKMVNLQKAAFSYAPADDGEYTPLIPATGAAADGVHTLSFDDLLTMEGRFDDAEIPAEGRILVLNAKHKAQLKKEDRKIYKDMMKDKEYAGFKVYTLASKRMPRYNKDTGAKVAYGAAEAATDTICSVFFHKDEVMRAKGTADMFATIKDPVKRGDIIGFQMRFIALSIRGKGIGAIYSAASA